MVIAVLDEGETYNCIDRDPCTQDNLAAGYYYHAHDDPTLFIQCSPLGDCLVRPCPYLQGSTIHWNQATLQCEFVTEDQQTAATDETEGSKLYFKEQDKQGKAESGSSTRMRRDG